MLIDAPVLTKRLSLYLAKNYYPQQALFTQELDYSRLHTLIIKYLNIEEKSKKKDTNSYQAPGNE